jgi:predicted lipoprotein with Yx(FWY)xxD motif
VAGSRRKHGSMSTTRRRRGGGFLLAVALGASAFAGCGSSGNGAASSGTNAGSSTSTTSATSSGSGGSGATPPVYEVTTGSVPGLGQVLVDGQGLTLYLFVPDKQSGSSTCYAECASAWPPLLLPDGVTAPVAGPGIKASLLATTHRTDGTVQVTYNKWPLYTWAGDSGPGQASGQGLNNLGGLWYVLSPDGATITKKS